MSAAHGGQVVCERGIMDDVVREWKQRAASAATGQVLPTSPGSGVQQGAAAASPHLTLAVSPASPGDIFMTPPPSPGEMRVARGFLNSFTR